MQHFKIVNIHTNKVINLNYTELQDFMRINRKDFFYNYTIQRINKPISKGQISDLLHDGFCNTKIQFIDYI